MDKEKVGSYQAHKENMHINDWINKIDELREASKNRLDYFVTEEKSILDDRVRLEKIFDIRIVTPKEMEGLDLR
jgi:hypothetical protein